MALTARPVARADSWSEDADTNASGAGLDSGVEASAGDAVTSPDSEAVPDEAAGVGDALEDEEEIIVTGSRVKRSSFAASAPVHIITREELEYSGAQNLSAALSYFRRNQLLASERDFTAEEGPPGGLGGNWSTRGNPGTFLAPTLMPDPACVDPETRPAGSEVRTLDPFGDLCYFTFRPFSALTDNLERTAVYAHGQVDITNHTRLFAEASVSKTRTDSIGSPSFPFNVRPVVPADHVDNFYGMDVPFIGRALGAEAGGAISETDDDTLRTAFGLRGDLEGVAANTVLEDWEWELYGTFGVSRYNRFLPDTVVPDFEEALGACTDRRALEGCYNPFYSAVLGTGTPRSQEVIESFSGALMGVIDQHLQTYNAGVSGSLLELPGGDLGLALGGEIRHELRTCQLDHNTNNFELLFYHGDEDGYGEREVYGGYLELVAPVYDGVELQLAGRLEEYEDAGSTGNPTLGLLLNPAELTGSDAPVIQRWQLRGHVSRAFRAPHLFQTFNGSTTVPGAFLPPGAAVPIFAPVRRIGNPDLDPEKALAFSAGTTWVPTEELLLELDFWHFDYEDRISQESATRLYDDVVMQVMDDPTFSDPRVELDDMLAPQRITVTYVNLPGHVITQGIDFRVMLTLETDGAGTVRVGTDGTYTFKFQLDRERISTITLMDGSEFDLPFCDGDTCNVAGHLNSGNVAAATPELRVNFPLSWSLSDHVVSLTAHYMTGLEDWEPSRFDEDNMRPYTEIDGYFTLDLGYAYTLRDVIGSSTQFRVGVYNLLEQDPPFADLLNGISGLHDPRGRVVYASITQDF